eukprot:TRINITY_DN20886_c0_g1_i1.p1 TRINITY_DN20886_c0_g1~~TRINITY_DN20886_c0_g1_i1.p1  ORF type:complete len:521 (-),score=54.93 TRINITY_DN20886_c0_g1_i1:275-1837(-)
MRAQRPEVPKAAQKKLFAAAEKRKADDLKQLLNQYAAAIHIEGGHGASLLHAAASHGNADSVHLLLDSNIEVNKVAIPHNFTALDEACYWALKHRDDLLKGYRCLEAALLIATNGGLCLANGNGEERFAKVSRVAPLITRDAVRALREEKQGGNDGMWLERANRCLDSCLGESLRRCFGGDAAEHPIDDCHVAAKDEPSLLGDTDSALSVHWSARDKKKMFEAARTDNAAVCTALIRSYPGIVHVTDGSGKAPLHEAAGCGSIEVARLLLESGADVTAVNNRDWRALEEALYWEKQNYNQPAKAGRCQAVIELLKARGCNAEFTPTTAAGEKRLRRAASGGPVTRGDATYSTRRGRSRSPRRKPMRASSVPRATSAPSHHAVGARPGSNAEAQSREVRVDKLLYTQASMSDTFRDGRTFEDLLEELQSNDPDWPLHQPFLHLQACDWPGRGIFVVNNRRLRCLKLHQRRVHYPVCIKIQLIQLSEPQAAALDELCQHPRLERFLCNLSNPRGREPRVRVR